MHYENPTPVVVALVELTGPSGPALLGVVRGIEPGYGGLALPGGYVDKGESIEDALARETREETGLESAPGEWRLVTSRITPHNRVLIFGVLRRSLGHDWARYANAPCAREILALQPVGKDDTMVFPLHQDVANLYFAGRLFA